MIDPRDWLNEKLAEAYIQASGKRTHTNTCNTSVAPARRPGPCDCEATDDVEVAMDHWGRTRAMAVQPVVGSPRDEDQREAGPGAEDREGHQEAQEDPQHSRGTG